MLRVAHLVSVHAVTQLVNNFCCGGHSDVGHDKRFFKIVVKIVSNLLICADNVLKFFIKTLARFFQTEAEFLKNAHKLPPVYLSFQNYAAVLPFSGDAQLSGKLGCLKLKQL